MDNWIIREKVINNINILDSTLRDGGYCNNWSFGTKNKKKIVEGLYEAGVDIIECGILSDGTFTQEQSKYSSVENISDFVSMNGNEKKTLVILMNYGEYDVEKLPESGDTVVDGIRLAFHKKDLYRAIEQMGILKSKNYKVFMQPMATITYTTEEYIELITCANKLNPYAFYIVDSYGSMKPDELMMFCELAKHILNKSIVIGFHAHNNLQLAYSNALLFEKEIEHREAIIDCCVMGMGRGAGNLNTELFLSHLNQSNKGNYKIEPILVLIDEIINHFYQQKSWGYSLPNYLSASHSMHPNYGMFLADKNTLTVSMMNELLSLVSVDKKNQFDRRYFEDLYVSYMSARSAKDKVPSSLKSLFQNAEVLVVAPGKSVDTEINKIKDFVNNTDVCVISVNFSLNLINSDYIFVSNPKRYEELDFSEESKMILTSNINSESNCIIVDYLDLLCDETNVRDNATMMLIKLLINSDVKKIYLAGLDGYEGEYVNNYTQYSNALITSKEYMNQMNRGMNNMLHKYMENIDISFVTTERIIRRD